MHTNAVHQGLETSVAEVRRKAALLDIDAVAVCTSDNAVSPCWVLEELGLGLGCMSQSSVRH